MAHRHPYRDTMFASLPSFAGMASLPIDALESESQRERARLSRRKYRRWLKCEVLVRGYKGTFRSFFQDCLLGLVHEGDGFSGKRPLGNSDWQDDLFSSLVYNNIVRGEIDPETRSPDTYGTAFGFNQALAMERLRAMIAYM